MAENETKKIDFSRVAMLVLVGILACALGGSIIVMGGLRRANRALGERVVAAEAAVIEYRGIIDNARERAGAIKDEANAAGSIVDRINILARGIKDLSLVLRAQGKTQGNMDAGTGNVGSN